MIIKWITEGLYGLHGLGLSIIWPNQLEWFSLSIWAGLGFLHGPLTTWATRTKFKQLDYLIYFFFYFFFIE